MLRGYIWLLIPLVWSQVDAELNVPQLLVNEKNIGGAGTKARLSKKGVQYVSQILSGALITEVVTAPLTLNPENLNVGNEKILLADMTINAKSSRHNLTTDIQPPDTILVSFVGLDLKVSARLTNAAQEEKGTVKIGSESITLDLEVVPTRTTQGAPNIRLKSCKVANKAFIVTMTTEAPDEDLTKTLEAEAHDIFEGFLCARVEFIVEDRINDRFGLLSPKVTLAHINDDELIKDLADRLRARRQRRHPYPGNLGAGMNLPMGFNLGAGLGRKKRNAPWGNLGAGMNLPMGMNLGAGLGRKKRSPGWELPSMNGLSGMSPNMGVDMRWPEMNMNSWGRKKRSPGWELPNMNAEIGMDSWGRKKRNAPYYPGNLGAGIGLPMGLNLGAGLGRKKRSPGWEMPNINAGMPNMGAGMTMPNMDFGNWGRKKRDAGVIPGFNVSHMDALFLDYTIKSDLKVTNLGLEIESSGEVSLRGRGGTPFGPVPAPLPESVHEDSMLQMIVSDYMPNSLMYHGHTIGLFKTRVDPTTPHFGPIMKTTCSLSTGMLFCLGDLFPTLRKTYPDRRLVLFFNTLQAPVIVFHPASSGGIKFALIGRIAILVVHPQTKAEELVAEMKIDVDAQMKMRLSSSMVRPKISLDRIKLTTMSPGILLQNELDDAVLLAREVLQRMVNDLLKDGIPIPVHPLFKLVKPKVKVIDRALLLQTNFELNERLMRQLTAGDLDRRRRF
ncbi:unnamed protein product [Bursaphelenchus xylophilus]|uniref:(pine wood nematode) hypothetical protein n=1 Tax=Bursaphelenchus xylophilus TaxID=6326 RepID=A0A1I7SSS5_BURXY|nr:unnamed protein product [Bursaphelenchus xylophilus]CAG9108897.1 unnamed protein product [Bursaphelenchus xylophilus]